MTNLYKKSTSIILGAILFSVALTSINIQPANAFPIVVCSVDGEICKSVVITDQDGDGIIELNELITYDVTITASNTSGDTWSDVSFKDRFGGDLLATEDSTINADCDITAKGKTAKNFLDCTVDDGAGDNDLSDGESASADVTATTDFNPGQAKKSIPKQEYTSCGQHDMNSGASITYTDINGIVQEASTPPVTVDVFTTDQLGDCDGDGFSDADEVSHGTDPFDPADFPACGGSSIVDICVDGDGVATAGSGSFTILKGALLTTWPTGFGSEGIDWFDTDASGTWTLGDDLHAEDPAGSCPTAIRNAVHDIGSDCKVLDLDASLVGGEPVSCDLESGTFCSAAQLADLASVGIKFEDANVSTLWDSGEDIILDTNGNGIFD